MADREKTAAVAEAERIMGIETEGYAWAPLPSIRRYGMWRGLVLPIFMNPFIYSDPPVIENAPAAGRRDWQDVQAARRTKAA